MADTRLVDLNTLGIGRCDPNAFLPSAVAYCAGWNGVINLLEGAPVVDAVEVVRCKDCTQWGGVAFGNVCRRWSAPLAGMKNCTGPDDYCSYGERKNKNP